MSEKSRPDFVPGLELSRRYYLEAVRPILDVKFPGLRYAAARIGHGSEVLGYDDATSTDHHWGPQLQLFLRSEEIAHQRDAIDSALRMRLPNTFLGYSTNFSAPNPEDNGVRSQVAVDDGPINHMVSIWSARGYFLDVLGYDVDASLEPSDWLTFPMQKLAALTGGAVFHDDVGLGEVRHRLLFYPRDIWLYLMAAGWARIGQEEHLMGRAGSVGDEVGAGIIAARLVRDIMRLCFLMERRYAPYPKWFGTAFRELTCAQQMLPELQCTLHATTWQERERGLVPAYEALARLHNALQITQPMPEKTVLFHGRPFQAMAIHGFADALLAEISDSNVRAIAELPLIGNIDLFSDNTDLLENPEFRPALRRLYSPTRL